MTSPWRKEAVVDNFHGTPVADPYRWLEDADDEETREFVQWHNERTAAYLAQVPERTWIRGELSKLWNFARVSAPVQVGDLYFYDKNDGLQNQSVLYVQQGLNGEPRELLNPNALSADGTVELSGLHVNVDGSKIAWASSHRGSDWQEIRVRDVATGEDGPDVIRWCKFTACAWTADGRGFYYSRLPEPGTVPAEDQNHYRRVYWHELGWSQAQDVLVYERPDEKEWFFDPQVTADGRYLCLSGHQGTDMRNRLYVREIDHAHPGASATESPFIHWLDDFDATYRVIGNRGALFYVHTTDSAPRGRVVAIDLTRAGREHWREVVAQGTSVIDSVRMVNGRLVVAYLRDACHEVKLVSLAGDAVGTVGLPGIGSLLEMTGKDEQADVFLSFTSFLQPPTVFRYDVAGGRLHTWFRPHVPFAADEYETSQVFFTSKDGTRVPMFVTHRKGLELDGQRPTLLTGYGGFNISRTPSYSVPPLVLLEQGGVFALANLRGGGEYGEEWHQAGMFERKQNVFDDFIAAAEWLCDNGYTQPKKLAITGGSNGGLLVAACMLQRPDLYGAVVCRVPVIDMLRYHHFTVGRFWTSEYGDAQENPDHFRFMLAYSPLHNVKAGGVYPPLLVMTGDTDDRVVPAHSFKFTATLQEKAASADQVWLRVEQNAGHGHGKPVTKLIAEEADVYAFLFHQLGVGAPVAAQHR